MVFHARIAAEATDGSAYTIDDVAEGIVAKLIRRHPHVFADVTVSGPEEVKRNWDAIKAAERAEAGDASVSALDAVPFGQPALALAAQLQRRAERAGAPAELASLPTGRPTGAGRRPARQARLPRLVAARGAGWRGRWSGGRAGARDGDGPAQRQAVSDIGAELFALVAKAREAGLTPNSSCAPPPVPTATGSAPGSAPGAAREPSPAAGVRAAWRASAWPVRRGGAALLGS